MSDKNTEKSLEDMLKQYFKKNRYYDADELYSAINEKEKEFMQLLNTKERIEFVKLRSMYERQADLLQQDSFSKGFFEGVGCNDKQ